MEINQIRLNNGEQYIDVLPLNNNFGHCDIIMDPYYEPACTGCDVTFQAREDLNLGYILKTMGLYLPLESSRLKITFPAHGGIFSVSGVPYNIPNGENYRYEFLQREGFPSFQGISYIGPTLASSLKKKSFVEEIDNTSDVYFSLITPKKFQGGWINYFIYKRDNKKHLFVVNLFEDLLNHDGKPNNRLFRLLSKMSNLKVEGEIRKELEQLILDYKDIKHS